MEIVLEIFDQESKYGILFLQNSQKVFINQAVYTKINRNILKFITLRKMWHHNLLTKMLQIKRSKNRS